VNNIIGKKFVISGMSIEIISEKGDKWEARNTTTNKIVLFDKTMFEKAIKLGKTEHIN